MAKTPTPQTLGQNIRARREAAPLSVSRFTTMICMQLPQARWVTDETVRRYEKDILPAAGADPILVAAMATVLGCEVEELDARVAEDMLTIRDLLANFRWYEHTAA